MLGRTCVRAQLVLPSDLDHRNEGRILGPAWDGLKVASATMTVVAKPESGFTAATSRHLPHHAYRQLGADHQRWSSVRR